MKTIMCSLDISTNNTGFAVFENGKYKTSFLLNHSTNKDERTRSIEMAQDILKYLEEYKPAIVSIEDTYCGFNPSSMKKLTRLQGVVFGWAISQKADFNLYTPSSWRKEFGDLFKSKKREECKKIAVNYVNDKYKKEVNDDEAEAILIGEATVMKYE